MVRKAGLWCALMSGVWMAGGAPALAADTAAVIETYADVAHAKYEDALTTAEALEKAIDALIAKPTEDNLKAARTAWLAARDPYQQTEGYRFGNPIVDDWEGKVNAWPLDEGLIDYVAEAYGTEFGRQPALHRQRDRQHQHHLRRRDHRHQQDHQGAAGRQAA